MLTTIVADHFGHAALMVFILVIAVVIITQAMAPGKGIPVLPYESLFGNMSNVLGPKRHIVGLRTAKKYGEVARGRVGLDTVYFVWDGKPCASSSSVAEHAVPGKLLNQLFKQADEWKTKLYVQVCV
jgi:hypothetical protein